MIKNKFYGWDDEYLKYLSDSWKCQLKKSTSKYRSLEIKEKVAEIEVELKRREDENDHIYDEGYGG